MPPRRRAAGRRPSGGRVSDRGSAQQSETPIRGRGQGHRGARIRGGQRQRPLHDIPVESSNQSSPAISTSSRHNIQEETHDDFVEENIAVKLTELIKLNPPTFSGSSIQEDPIEFLEGIEKRCRALRCPDVQYVELAIFQLTGVANG